MQLSVEVNNLSDAMLLVCRGEIVQGPESDYLFALATRADRRDVVLDVGSVTAIDQAGLLVILLSYALLVASERRLFLRNPSPEMLERLRREQTKLDNLSATAAMAAPAAWRQAVQ
jgi:anti-anti-sigma regulatory factor